MGKLIPGVWYINKFDYICENRYKNVDFCKGSKILFLEECVWHRLKFLFNGKIIIIPGVINSECRFEKCDE